MTNTSKSRGETRNMIIAAIMVVGLGAGTATAAISVGGDNDVNPAMRPLTISRGIAVQPAFGPDDEDCVYAIHKIVLQNGKIRTERHLECAD